MVERSVWLERLLVAAAVLLTAWGIGSYGLWDPWELAAADAAFGHDELSSRLPAVLAGLLTCVLAFVALRRGLSARAGMIAILVMVSTPLFLLNSRLLTGDSFGFAAQAWVGAAAFAAASERGRHGATLSFALLAVGTIVSAKLNGVLLGPLPPLLAVATWSFVWESSPDDNLAARWLFPTVAVVLLAGVVRAVGVDSPEPSVWLGAGAVGGNPPSHDKALELIFHGFAPWSAALPVAAVWTLAPREGRSALTQKLAWLLLLWAAFGFVSWTLFASRYGTPPFLALLPLAGITSIWLTELSDESASRWPAAVVVALLTALLIRDYALYPESPLRALALDGLRVPDVYEPTRQWALVLALAGAAICLTLVSHEQLPRPRPRDMAHWLRAQWETDRAARGWMLLVAILLAACIAFGSMCLVLELRIPSLVVRVGQVAFFVPFALLGLVLGLPWLRYVFGQLGALRVFATLATTLAVGAFTALSFQPALSLHFSPRPVYEAFTELSDGRAEPLASYRLSTAAARYYTNAPIEEIGERDELLRFLQQSEQRWAVVQAEHLPALNVEHRRTTGEHLYVADARSSRLLLLASRPVEGRPNESFIAQAVLDEAPEPQYPVAANYDDRIELLGYDLGLPRDGFVGPGQRFTVTWYWQVLGEPPPGYQVFVHVDGHGLRLNGDHEPVGGRYPTKLWETGDVIVDSQELTVPPNFRSGDYVMYVGLFSGANRLKVKTGPNDGTDRVRAGVLPVR